LNRPAEAGEISIAELHRRSVRAKEALIVIIYMMLLDFRSYAEDIKPPSLSSLPLKK